MKTSPDHPSTRRDFLQLVFGWSAAFFALGSSAVAAMRFMVPNVLYEPDLRFKALKPEDYPEGATFLPEARIFLERKGNTFRAVSAVCTHLGCTVNQSTDGKGFHCPCHGSQFDANAAVVGGPAPRGLPWYLVTLSADGRIVIDATQQVKSDKYLIV